MPSLDDIYGMTTAKPEVVTPPPAAPAETALARFRGGIGTDLKADMLRVLDVTVRPVETDAAALLLADQRAQVRTLLKNVEDRRKRTVEPLKREAAAVDAEARTWTEPVKAWDQKAERALLAYQRFKADRARREQEQREAEMRKAAEALGAAEEKGDAVAADAANVAIMRAEAAAPAPEVRGWKTEAGSQSVRRTWKVEVVDPAEVPPVYLVPDLQKLQAAVNAGAREIPGCNIFEHESLPVRTRT